jgi:hypothetical protein
VKTALRALTAVVGLESRSTSQINAAIDCNISAIPAAEASIRGKPFEMRLHPTPEHMIPYPRRKTQVDASGI